MKRQSKIEALFYLKSGIDKKIIKEKTGLSLALIYQICNENGLKEKYKKRTKNNLNQEFFKKIDTEEKAYFLGLLYADGYIHDKNSLYYCTISLLNRDLDILKKFKDIIGFTGDIKFYKNKTGNIMGSLHFCSKEIVNDLIKCGCFNNKSLTIRFPLTNILPPKLTHHFIRGYFDGDGGIWRGSRKNRWTVNITSNKNFLNDLANIFLIPNNIKYYIQDHKTYGELVISGNNQIREFLIEIYKDSGVYMERKYKLYKQFIEEQDFIKNIPMTHWINRKRNERGQFK